MDALIPVYEFYSTRALIVRYLGGRNNTDKFLLYLLYQQKLTLRLIYGRCVLTQAMSFLRPVRPVRPVLHRNHPLYPLRPDPPSNPLLPPDEISPRPGGLKTSQLQLLFPES